MDDDSSYKKDDPTPLDYRGPDNEPGSKRERLIIQFISGGIGGIILSLSFGFFFGVSNFESADVERLRLIGAAFFAAALLAGSALAALHKWQRGQLRLYLLGFFAGICVITLLEGLCFSNGIG